MILGFMRPNGTAYTVLPDIFVYRKPMDRARTSFSVRRDGPPVLVVEVASESTYESDLNVIAGKGWTYAEGSVQEYLVLDPAGLFVQTPISAWRLVDNVYQKRGLDAEGLWWSEELPIGIGVSDGLVAVYDRLRRRAPREGEVLAELARRDAELALFIHGG
jgi:Uma2 family endonuclease